MSFANYEMWARGTAEEILARGNCLGQLAYLPLTSDPKEEFAIADTKYFLDKCMGSCKKLLKPNESKKYEVSKRSIEGVIKWLRTR